MKTMNFSLCAICDSYYPNLECLHDIKGRVDNRNLKKIIKVYQSYNCNLKTYQISNMAKVTYYCLVILDSPFAFFWSLNQPRNFTV